MPDLVFRRDGTHPPVKNACMYCGRPATHTRTRDITNPRLDPPPGGGRFDLPRGGGDDFGCFAIVLLPFLLANIVFHARDEFRHRKARRAAPPLVPPSTTVTIATCERHRRFRRRWVRVVLAWFVSMLLTWALLPLLRGQGGDAPLWVFAAVIVSTVAAPLILLMLWGEYGTIRVERVGRDTVTLTRVRQAYFDATP